MLLTKSWKKYWRKLSFFIIFILGLALLSLLLFIVNSFFSIRTVEVIGTKSVVGIDYLENKNILLLSSADIKKNLLRHNPIFKDIDVAKIYPQKIVISAILEKASAELLASGGVFDLTSGGKIIKKSRNRDKSLIPINMYQKYEYNQYNIGEIFKNADLQYCLFFIDKFKDLRLETDSVDISVSDMIIFKDGQTSYVLSPSRDKSLQYEDLKRIVERSYISGVKYKSIDVRFDKPIITF